MKIRLSLLFITMGCLVTANLWAAKKTDCKDESQYPTISKKELAEVADKKTAFIVDVNSDESYKKVHIPGAVHFGSNKKEFTKLLPEKKDALIVAYCGGVKCGAWKQAAEEACEQGYTNIRHFKEGISGWTAQN